MEGKQIIASAKYTHFGNSFFDRVLGDESIDHDFVLLSDSVRTTERLNIIMWIPVTVINDNSICSGQVDT